MGIDNKFRHLSYVGLRSPILAWTPSGLNLSVHQQLGAVSRSAVKRPALGKTGDPPLELQVR